MRLLIGLSWFEPRRGGGGWVLPRMSYTERLRIPKRSIFFRLKEYERVGISFVEVYKSVGKSVIWSVKGPKGANR